MRKWTRGMAVLLSAVLLCGSTTNAVFAAETSMEASDTVEESSADNAVKTVAAEDAANAENDKKSAEESEPEFEIEAEDGVETEKETEIKAEDSDEESTDDKEKEELIELEEDEDLLQATTASGTCGANLQWTLTNYGELTISGSGEMDNWEYYSSDSNIKAPWSGYRYFINSVVIRQGVTTIGNEAFYNLEYVKSVRIEGNVTSIGKSAFSGCDGLTSINIPNSVTSIENFTFSGCDELTSITIPNSVTSIGKSAFSGCEKLTSINIPNGVTSIGENAFSGCDGLTSITIPNSVTSMGYSMFSECDRLTNITIPDSVNSMGNWMFSGCKELTDIYYGDCETKWKYLGGNNGLPDGVTVHFAKEDAPTLTKVENLEEGVEVHWYNVAGVYNYRIYYRVAGGNWKAAGDKEIGRYDHSEYLVKGLTSGKEYEFTVRGLTADGKKYSTAFDPKGLKIQRLAQPVISGLACNEAGVTVKWPAVPGAAKYRIYYRPYYSYASSSGWKEAGETSATNFTVQGMKWGRTYDFTVEAIGRKNGDLSSYDAYYGRKIEYSYDSKSVASGTANMYRLYNPNSGEHFYTGSAGERDYLVKAGWSDEGIGWVAPKKSKIPVYRLYNPNSGDHHYTMSAGEKNYLVKAGWKYEGIGWYSDAAKKAPLYRQYNPNAVAGSHNYTLSKGENDHLVKNGWKAEGIGWYGVKPTWKKVNF